MHLSVDLFPNPKPVPTLASPVQAGDMNLNHADVVVVVDVLMSGTLAPLLFDNGLKDLYISKSARSLRTFARYCEEKNLPKAEQNGATLAKPLLLGEANGVPLEGFNYGTLPLELIDVPIQGGTALMLARNAPLALAHFPEVVNVFLGSLYNAEAVIEQALKLAKTSIAIVGSGHQGSPDLDDALALGLMTSFLRHRLEQQGVSFTLSGVAEFTMSILQSYYDPLEALWQSRAGTMLRQANQAANVAFASCIAQSQAVPVLSNVIESEPANLYHFEVLNSAVSS